MPGDGSELGVAWWRERLAGTTCTPMTPAEVEEVRRAQGVTALPPAYEGFLLAAGRGCSHVWEADQCAYHPDLLEARAGAEELLAECRHPFTLGPEDVVITLTGGYHLQLLRPGPADPVVHAYLEGDPGPVARVPFTEMVFEQLPGGRFGWRWDASGEAGVGRWAVWHFTSDLSLRARWLVRWAQEQVGPVESSSLSDVVALVEDGRLAPAGWFAGGDQYAVDGDAVRIVTRDLRGIDVRLVDGAATFGAEEVRAHARSRRPPAHVPLDEVEAALRRYADQQLLVAHGPGTCSAPTRDF